jgi:hypothetical protein
MFDQSKDERLVFVNYKAGWFGFVVTSFLLLAANIVDQFMNDPERIDRGLLMFIPWFAGVWVYVILLIRGGYISAVREEETRTPAGLRSARMNAVFSGFMFAVFMFAMKFILPRDTESNEIAAGLISALVAGIFFGAVMWWMDARKTRNRKEKGEGER